MRPEGARPHAVKRGAVDLIISMAGLGLWMLLDAHRHLSGHHAPQTILATLNAREALRFALLSGAVLVAMGPCVMQMGLVLVAYWCGLPPSQVRADRSHQALKPAVWFLLGYLMTFGTLSTLLVVAGLRFPAVQPWLRGAAGLALVGSGALLLVGRARRPACGGPGGFLLRYGRLHPAAMGTAYAAYCSACCGPYLGALGLALAEQSVPGQAAVGGLILALVMALPVVSPFLSAFDSVQQFLSHHQERLARSSGLFLAGTGMLMALSAVHP